MSVEPLTVVYRIDGQDRVIHVNAGWIQFAHHNHGGTLKPQSVLGRVLWDYITDTTIQELYRQMVARARQGRPTRFRFRCDAPHRRRIFQMNISAFEGDVVQFESHLESEESRAEIPLLDPLLPHRSDTLLRMCSWCHDVDWPEAGWLPLESAVERLYVVRHDSMPRLTHGICPSCADSVIRQLDHR